MQWRLILTLAMACAVFSINGAAQNVRQADMRGQPLVYVKDGKITGCGVRFVVVDAPLRLTDQSTVTTYDLSFNLSMPPHPVVKGGSFDAVVVDFKRGDVSKTKPVTPASIWLKADGAPATSPQQGVLTKSDDAGFVL